MFGCGELKIYCELCWKDNEQENEADQYLVDEDDKPHWLCDVHMSLWRNSGLEMEEWLKEKGLTK